MLQAASELLQKDFHRQSKVKLFVVEPVDGEKTPGFLIIGST